MAVKSVIEIDIQDDKFKAFKSLYDDYQTALGEAPDKWKEANSEMQNAVGSGSSIADNARDTLGALTAQSAEQAKLSSFEKKEDDKRRKNAADRKKTDTDMLKRWKEISSVVISAGVGLAKFASIGAGLATGAGAFGMGKLANDASQTRFSSMGLGISSGAMQSANLNYAKLLGSPTQSLSAIRESQTDVSQSWKFSALGIHGQEGKQSSELLPEVLTKIRDTLKAAPTSQRENIAKAYGMGSFTSAEDRQRMVAMSDAEFTAENKRYQNDIKLLAVSDSTLKSYQDLDTQWERFKQQAENTFMKGLEPLAPALTRFSESVNTAFSKLMLSDKLEPMINKLADGITRFSAYLTSPEAEKDFDKFVTFIKSAAESLGAFAAFIGTITPEKALAAGAVGVGGMALAGAAGSALVGGAALPLAGAAAGGAMLGSSVYNNDTIENQQWTQDIVGGLAAFFGDKDAIEAQKAQTNFKNLSTDIGKPMSADEYKKADDDSRSSFIKGIGGEFKTALSDLWEKTKTVAGDVVSDTAAAIETNATYTPMGDVKTTGGQRGMMSNIYEAYKKAGLSDKQARVMTAEVGRENDYQDKYVFGSHTDPHNKATNTGFLSWQGTRGSALRKRLEAKGLFKNGQMSHSQEAIDEQARFSVDELKSGQYSGIGNFMENKNVDYQTGSRQLGKGYVKWRYDDPKYAHHKTREAGYYNKLGQVIGSQPVSGDYRSNPKPQRQSVMLQKQQGGYDMQQGRGMKLEINNATGGNTILSAATL